jgi:hypothetical protein
MRKLLVVLMLVALVVVGAVSVKHSRIDAPAYTPHVSAPADTPATRASARETEDLEIRLGDQTKGLELDSLKLDDEVARLGGSQKHGKHSKKSR